LLIKTTDKNIVIISDTHFGDDNFGNFDLLEKFIQEYANFADELYILGDLFNLYLGDDLIKTHYQKITNLLKNNSCKVFIMIGNRDFLIAENFAKKSNSTIIQEPYILKTKDKNFVLIHGDSLVSGDKSYQRFKKIIQNNFSKKLLLSLPKKWRKNLASKIQKSSKKSKQKKSLEIMDIDEKSLFDFMKNYPDFDIIHGHTHRQNIHNYQNFKRFVLGDWQKNQGNFFQIKSGKIDFHKFNL
jgi:UDP-2,3-diacylglucosamine hydrolase